MSRRSARTLVQLFSLLVLTAVLLQSPAALIYAAPKPAQNVTATPSQTTETANNVVDGHTVDDQDTVSTNFFLSNDSGGAAYLNTLQSRGLNPFNVRYVRVGSAAGNTSATDGLVLLTEKLNDVAAKCGGPKVVSTEAWIGGIETSSGASEGGLLFVATLDNGDRKLVAAVNADQASLNGTADPVVSAGDFFGPSVATGCLPIAVIIICWIRCIIFKQIIILLRCIVVNIIACVRIGWTIVCFRARVVCCALLIFIRIIIICFIECIVIYIGANQAKPVGADGTVLAKVLPKAHRSPTNSRTRPVRSLLANRRFSLQAHS